MFSFKFAKSDANNQKKLKKCQDQSITLLQEQEERKF